MAFWLKPFLMARTFGSPCASQQKDNPFLVVVAFSAAPPAFGEVYNHNYRLSAVDFYSAGDQVDYDVDGLVFGSYTNDTAYLNNTDELDHAASENKQFRGGTCGTVSPHGRR